MVKFYLFLIALGCLVNSAVLAQSKAHERSGFAIIDPAYSSEAKKNTGALSTQDNNWLYGPAELECYRLDLLQRRKDSARLNVGYTGVFHHPYTSCSFRLELKSPKQISNISFRAVGQGELLINGAIAGTFNASDAMVTISLKNKPLVTSIRFDLDAPGDLPALLPEIAVLKDVRESWEWCTPQTQWEPAYSFPQNTLKVPPHRLEDPTIKLKPVSIDSNIYDFGRELLGYVYLRSQEKPVIGAGESKEEALSTIAREQSTDLVLIDKGLWRTQTPVAFRYIKLDNSGKDNIWTEAIFRPATYGGAFACSDTLLTRIWMNSAYTLRLCMHDFLLDGVKRDRLPWAGDLAMSSLVNAYTFGDKELVRRSLVALGRAGIGEQDINGIADFSLWWIIAQDQYQLYFDDPRHLKYEWHRIKETLDLLGTLKDTNGFLVPRKGARVFIDWVKQEKWTALQVLWWWAQNSAVKLALRAGVKTTADQWQQSAEKLKDQLYRSAWSNREQRWYSGKDSLSEKTRHPNFFAVVSGLSGSEQYPGIKAFMQGNTVKAVGSPYMAGFEMMGLARLGDIDGMLQHVKEYWGGMLGRGATTFWEAYAVREKPEKQYSFYSRPFGKSLCHAWSAGPAAFLPSELLGLRPLEDGWKRFSLIPNPGSLEWVNACVETRYGKITVDIDGNKMKVVIPSGTALEWKGQLIAGPRVFQTER